MKKPSYKPEQTQNIGPLETFKGGLEFCILSPKPDLANNDGIIQRIKMSSPWNFAIKARPGERAWLRVGDAFIPHRHATMFLYLVREVVSYASGVESSKLPGSSFAPVQAYGLTSEALSSARFVTDTDTLSATAKLVADVAFMGVSKSFIGDLRMLSCMWRGMQESVQDYLWAYDSSSKAVCRHMVEYITGVREVLGLTQVIPEDLRCRRIYEALEALDKDAYWVTDGQDGVAAEGGEAPVDAVDAVEAAEADGEVTLLKPVPSGMTDFRELLPVPFANALPGGGRFAGTDADAGCEHSLKATIRVAQDMLPYALNLLYRLRYANRKCEGFTEVAVMASPGLEHCKAVTEKNFRAEYFV